MFYFLQYSKRGRERRFRRFIIIVISIWYFGKLRELVLIDLKCLEYIFEEGNP